MARPERRFYFSLARELGLTVRQLLDNIDSHELSEWVAFFNIGNKKSAGQEKKGLSEKIKAFFALKKKAKK